MKHDLKEVNSLLSAYNHGRMIYVIRLCYNELLLGPEVFIPLLKFDRSKRKPYISVPQKKLF